MAKKYFNNMPAVDKSALRQTLDFNGELQLSGVTANHLTVDNGITGSLEGTASYSTTASYAETIEGQTLADLDDRFVNTTGDTIVGNLVISGSLNIENNFKQILTGTDTGIEILEQFSVGQPYSGKESIFGEGHAYGVGLEDVGAEGTPVTGSAWHFDFDNMSGTTITGATDITTLLSKQNGGSAGLFGGTTSGKTILVGSEYRYGGVKVMIDTPGTVEPQNVQAEYLYGGTTWLPVRFMATLAEQPYTRLGWTLGSTTSEQWRFEFDPEYLPVPWIKSTLNINGVDHTKYWARFRILSTITSDPVIDIMQLHPNRTKINDDGMIEMFGRARQPFFLRAGLHGVIGNSLSTAGTVPVQYSSGVTANYPYNRFANNATDGFLLTQAVPEELDTSISLQFLVSWYVDGPYTGDVQLSTDIFYVNDGFVYDGNNIPQTYSKITTVAAPSDKVRYTTRIKIPIHNLNAGGALIYLYRDATNGNPNDTLAGNIVLSFIQLIGYRWRA